MTCRIHACRALAAALLSALVGPLLAGCGPGAHLRGPLFAQVAAERENPRFSALGDSPKLREGDALLAEAVRRSDAGEPAQAELLLETARATWGEALALARQADSASRAETARRQTALAAQERATILLTEADEVRAIEEAEAKVGTARAQARVAAMDAAGGARDKARRLAGESALLDAAETCTFARILGAKVPAVDAAVALLRSAERRQGSGANLLETATAARTACLALHAPETARDAELRVVLLDQGIDAAASMGLEASRDAMGLTFTLGAGGSELEALASFVQSYGGVTLVVDRRSEPGLPVDVQSAATARALGTSANTLTIAPRISLSEQPRRRTIVRVAPLLHPPPGDETRAAP